MLEFSILYRNPTSLLAADRKAGGNQTGTNIPENQDSIFNVILHQSLFHSTKMLMIMHNLGDFLVACFYYKAGQQASLDALKNDIENEETNKKCSFKGIFIISNI